MFFHTNYIEGFRPLFLHIFSPKIIYLNQDVFLYGLLNIENIIIINVNFVFNVVFNNNHS